MWTTCAAPNLTVLRRWLAAAGAALLLAGCAGGDLDDGLWITYNSQTSPYDPSFVQTAAESGAFYVEIYGQPFAARMDDQAIAQRISLPQWIGPTDATTMPGPDVNTNFRAILVFSPGFDGPLTDRACTAPGRIGTGTPRAGRVKLAAGFCIGERMGSILVAEQGGITGPQDPAFRSMLAQVMLALLPNANPNRPRGVPPFDRR
ncbi:hypothetical protein ACFOGJ_05935 [Marinibaculum pumilum]|uniref:DUF4136 domain-containing protein n=1 Tax=Marinibaculum pumilum TaxID=1766165 RepID=A0ABV7KXB0_9PROT